MSKKWTKVIKAINVTDIESDADGVFLSNDQMDKLETALPDAESDLQKKVTELETANKDLTQKVKDTETALTKANDEKKVLTDEKKVLEDKVVKLEKKPAETPTTVNKDKDINSNSEPEDGKKTPGKTKAEQERDQLASMRKFSFKSEEAEEGNEE